MPVAYMNIGLAGANVSLTNDGMCMHTRPSMEDGAIAERQSNTCFDQRTRLLTGITIENPYPITTAAYGQPLVNPTDGSNYSKAGAVLQASKATLHWTRLPEYVEAELPPPQNGWTPRTTRSDASRFEIVNLGAKGSQCLTGEDSGSLPSREIEIEEAP